MEKCIICSGTNFKIIATQMREGEGMITQCKDCGLVFQDADYSFEYLKNYYEDEYQRTNSLVSGEIQTVKEHFDDRKKTITPIFENIKNLLKKDMRVLEVGSGAGELLSLIKPFVKECVGVELNSALASFATEELGILTYPNDILALEFNETFDLIIIISTLDHLPNPVEVLRYLEQLLAENGLMYLEVPNRNEALNYFLPAEPLKNYMTFFWHKAHMFYFTEETLKKICEKVGLSAEITCRHDYTFKNYLNWYFRGQPQSGLVEGMGNTYLFSGNTDFEKRVNKLMEKADAEFREIMAQTIRGDSLCCIARRPQE